jgi:hypothetical protein
VFPAERGGYLDLHNFRNRQWKPAQRAAGIDPLRRVYDLRHTFATFALRAGISTFDLSRYMGASLTMIDRHYGHATDASTQSGSSTATRTSKPPTSKLWTSDGRRSRRSSPRPTTEQGAEQAIIQSPLRTRTVDPLRTMGSDRQPVATDGNGFGLFEPFSRHSHLPRVATGCDR